MTSNIERKTINGWLNIDKPAGLSSAAVVARVKEVFNVSKIGMVAGCEVLEGLVRRGAKARLIRDDVVVHEGSLGTLRHFKDDVREVKVGSDCGISFENYQDIQREDVIEAYEAKEVARSL